MNDSALLTSLTAAVLVLAATTPVLAQTAPAYLPTRDVVVTYHVTSTDAGRGAQDVSARWSSSLGRLRIEAGPIVLLVDPRARRATALMQNIALTLPEGDRSYAYMPDASTRFTRGGTDVVAGSRCTNWSARSDKGTGTACITDDGVILRGKGLDRNGRGGTVEASSVAYGSQPDGLFQVPPGTVKLQLPQGVKLEIPH